MATQGEDFADCKFIASQVKKLKQLPGNKQCADCRECVCPQCSMKEPNWISEDLQIIVCSECKAIHERVTDTSFKSLQMSTDWTRDSIQKVRNVSNRETNSVYERDIPPAFRKPTRCFDWRFREHWIKSKYIKKHFKERTNPPRYLWGAKAGYLWKRGRDDSLFMRRWFLLDVENEPILKYYSDADEVNIKGQIDLMKMDLCLTSEEKMDHPNAMQIFCGEGRGMEETRVIYLYSETAKELVEWYQAVRIRKYHQHLKEDPTSRAMNLGSDILHEGYLLKTGSRGTEAYRKRWFVLHGRELHYFKEPLDANPKGTISLDCDGISVILSGQRDRSGYHFKLKTPTRIFKLIAEDEQQRDLWIKAINLSCYQDDIFSAMSELTTALPVHMTPTPWPAAISRPKNRSLPSLPGGLSIQEETNSDSEGEGISLNYVYLQNGSILVQEKWDAQKGLMVKCEVLMLKIPPDGLQFTSDAADVTVSLLRIDLFEISRRKECGDVALTVKCEGSPSTPVVSVPMKLELYHCAVLSGKDNVKPNIWLEEEFSWKQVAPDDQRVQCQVLEHTFCITSNYFGSLVASMEGKGVLGKRMRCAAFSMFEENSKNLEVVVYIFNNHVSDIMWKMIEVNETCRNNSKLVDISNEFKILKENQDVLLSIETIRGLQLMPGNFSTLRIPFQEIWSKSYVRYHVELIQTAKSGLCQLIVAQEKRTNGQNAAVLNLKNSSDFDFEGSGVDPGKIERQFTPHAVKVPQHLARHSFDSSNEGAKPEVKKPQFSSQKSNISISSEEVTETLLPFPIKQELAKVLDHAPNSKDWRAFAIQMGVDYTTCESLVDKVSPTMDVFKECEYVESTIDEVKEALRYIQNEEAVDVLFNYFKDSS